MSRPEAERPGLRSGLVRDRGVPASREQASRTASASRVGSMLLLPAAIAPDERFNPGGRVLPTYGYDLGTLAPAWPSGGHGPAVQEMSADETFVYVLDLVGVHFRHVNNLRAGLRSTLEWLADFPGLTWEQRWLASGADAAPRSWRAAVRGGRDKQVKIVTLAANALMIARVLRPSYAWQLVSRSGANLAAKVFAVNDPDGLRRLQALPEYGRALERHCYDAQACLARVMIRTGRGLEELEGEHLLHYADIVRTSGRTRREHLAWELMVALGPFAGQPATMRAVWSAQGNTRQHSTATLVDRYAIPASGVRDRLVDYLGEVGPGMDYGSLQGLAYRLVRLFWWEVLQVNPVQADLRIDAETVAAWRARLAVTTDGRDRLEIHSILFAVRGLYRDLAEWAHEEPARWGPWVSPCPVPKRESRHASKTKRQQRARSQERTRALKPLLPALVAEAGRRRDFSARLLAAATTAAAGQEFIVDGARFMRFEPAPRRYARELTSQIRVHLIEAAPGQPVIRLQRGLVNATTAEADGFWAWAIVETLRHTGVRIEELLELTQLSLRHYTSQTTGTLVPLLHIVPSKTDVERLIPMSPELVTVLLAVQRRARGGQENVPLSIRYDPHEKKHGQPFPHLFARRIGARQEVISYAVVARLLHELAADAQLQDAGEPISFTPHDFRRLFATEMVGSGLPLHIAASLLGHVSLDTTRGYTAVFPQDVIEAHQHFIEHRRALRPTGELRTATGNEWDEFEEHFLLRKVALGDCHRPYGTPCVHEHACTRCRFLKVDPVQLPRIKEMTANAEARLDEARERTWLGEVAALEESLHHLRRRRLEAEAQVTSLQPEPPFTATTP